MSNEGNDTFMRITNRDIYDKIEEWIAKSDKRFEELNKKFDMIKTQTKINRWIAGASFTLVVAVITALLKFVILTK